MSVRDWCLRLTPTVEGDKVIFTPEEAAELRRKLREQEAEIERLRKEAAELRRRLSVHENPNVPPSVRNHSPGFARERPLVPLQERHKPGPKPGHPGSTREPLLPDRRVTLRADRCGRCRG